MAQIQVGQLGATVECVIHARYLASVEVLEAHNSGKFVRRRAGDFAAVVEPIGDRLGPRIYKIWLKNHRLNLFPLRIPFWFIRHWSIEHLVAYPYIGDFRMIVRVTCVVLVFDVGEREGGVVLRPDGVCMLALRVHSHRQ